MPIVTDLATLPGTRYPAGRRTRNIAGGAAPIHATNFSMGFVELDSNGGQVPWHNHVQEEVYFILRGEGELCLGEEIITVAAGQAVYVPSGEYHQLTNTSGTTLEMIYCYGPAGEIAHWRQELDGTLPRAGVEAPALPAGAKPQRLGDGKK